MCGTNSQNVYIWAKESQHFFENITEHPSHVMMWACFFDVSVNAESYLELSSHWLIPELDNMGLLNSVILQQDGAPA
jgi:hypothetical protein